MKDSSSTLQATIKTATGVLGSRKLAMVWLSKPAIGLDGRRPIDLLDTPAGIEAVDVLLTRMDHGVYC
jgi:putative toxin-antitoxin system antitoxin component (TIGR02293 family)